MHMLENDERIKSLKYFKEIESFRKEKEVEINGNFRRLECNTT